jgi:hypothetical protein
MLTDDGHEDRDFIPLLHPYPGEGRTARALMGEAANHFTGLTSRAAFRENGNSAHLDDLHICSL